VTRLGKRRRTSAVVALYLLPATALLGLGGTPPLILLTCFAIVGIGALVVGAGQSRTVHVGPLVLGLSLALLAMAGSLVPLPPGLLTSLSPAAAEMSKEAYLAAGLDWTGGPWSLAPGDTGVGIARTGLVLATLLFLRMLPDGPVLEHPGRALTVLGVVVLAVILVHAVTGLSAIYGVFPTLPRDFSPVISPFTNSNDLAALSCALVPLAVVNAMRGDGMARVAFAVLAIALAGVAILTLARSATLGLLVGVGIVMLGMLVAGRKLRAATLVGGAVVSVAVLIAAVGRLTERVGHLVNLDSLTEMDGRLGIWNVAWRIAQDHWLTGVGARSFGSAWWAARDQVDNVYPQNAEGAIPNMLATLGIPLTVVLVLLAAWVLGSVSRDAMRSAREGEMEPLGALAGLGALLAIFMFTATLSQPANAVVATYLFLLAGGGPTRGIGRASRWSLVALALLLASGAALQWGEPRRQTSTDRWFGSRLLADALEEGDDPIAVALLHPSDPYGFAWSGILLRRTNPARALSLVNRSMRLDLYGAEPHRAAANVLMAAGLDQQARGEIRRALGGATADELPRFITDVQKLFPEVADQVALLPTEGDAAVRAVLEFEAQGARISASQGWLALARRPVPPLDALATLVRKPSLAGPEETLALARAGRTGHPEDRRFAVLEGEALMAADERIAGRETLRSVLADDAFADDHWRSRAFFGLVDDRLTYAPASLDELLALRSGGGTSEEAARAWARGELLLADGQIAKAVRSLSTAVGLRPDVRRYSERLAAARESAR